MNVLLIDPVCPAPYAPDSLLTRPMGGTEATVLRVAEALSADGNRVTVLQRGRTEATQAGALYAPLDDDWPEGRWDAIVVVRDTGLLESARERGPDAKLLLWLHDLPDSRLSNSAIAATQPSIVTVSAFHEQGIRDGLEAAGTSPMPVVTHVYNPIDDDLIADDTPVDPDKLIFLSSPHKGLEWTLKVFLLARQTNPNFRLHIANPGYLATRLPEALPGVHDIGSLPHAEVMDAMRGALCVFNLNNIYPETFGLVAAEANALGVPVLTHGFGAAPEVLTDHQQLMDVGDAPAVVQRLMDWRAGARPVVRGDTRFRTPKVVKDWSELLCSTQRTIPGTPR